MEQTELTYIKIPYPNAKDLQLKITVPISSLHISPGIGNAWVTGKYYDPMEGTPVSVSHVGNSAQIIAIGAFGYKTPRKFLPQMTLSFGRLKPFSLVIGSGNSDDHFDFGGIPLSSLEIQYGGGNQSIDFSYPNPQVMRRMKIAADSGTVQIDNLGNANAEEIRLKGESTCYQIILGGALKQNTNIHVGIAVSKVEICIPAGTAVKIIAPNNSIHSLPNVLTYEDKAYWTDQARDHQEPLLCIYNTRSNGRLSLRFI